MRVPCRATGALMLSFVPDTIRVRIATAADAEATAAIYNAEVLGAMTTFDLVPRTVRAQQGWLAGHGGVYPAVVAEVDGGVLGFGALSPYRNRPAYATTVEDSVYVDEGARGQGTGRAILTRLTELARSGGFHTVIAHIAGDNDASVALHQACGFALVGVEREIGRKFGTWLDVAIFQYML